MGGGTGTLDQISCIDKELEEIFFGNPRNEKGKLEGKRIFKSFFKSFDSLFVPSSYIRHVRTYEGKNPDKVNRNIKGYLLITALELARLGLYAAVGSLVYYTH